MLAHALALRVRCPSLLVCRVVGLQFLSPFDPAPSKCILFPPSNAPVVVGLDNISDSSDWLLRPTDYAWKQASARRWACLRVRSFSAWNFPAPVAGCYLRGDLVKGFVRATVV